MNINNNIKCIPLMKHEVLTFKESYEPGTSQKMIWLQKICFWILKKLRVSSTPDLTFTVRHIDKQSVLEKILANQDLAQILSDPYRLNKCSTVLVGRDMISSLYHDQDMYYMTRFDTELGYRNRRGLVGGKHLDIIVCPWMEGAVVLPPEFDKS